MTQQDPVDDLDVLLRKARHGDQIALGRLLDLFRSDLKFAADQKLDFDLQARVDASDIVQQSCLSAVVDFPNFQGRTPGEFILWLRQIHERNVLDVVRQHRGAEKRAVRRERSLTKEELQAAFPNQDQSATPSRNAIQGESQEELLRAIETLPLDQQEVVRLRYLEAWSVQQIAMHLQRSDDAIGGLLRRGLRQLRKRLSNTEST